MACVLYFPLMTVTSEATGETGTTGRAAKLPRWRLVVAAVTVTIVVVLGGGYLLTTTSHRLEQGSWSWRSADAEDLRAGPTREVRYVFQRGGQLQFGASIRNPGPWPVTITNVAVNEGPAEYHQFKVVALTMTYTDGSEANTRDPMPFAATTVAVGAELWVYVTMTMPDVEMGPGSAMYFGDLAVTYRVLGMTRHEWVPMGFYLAMHVPEA